ncbi:MAG: hypothetical protein K6U89_06170 [Chloroflexi bacterium]|nr:hypothetical protein [Chloroflexota bacterium]
MLAQQSDPLFAKDAGHPGKAADFKMLHHPGTVVLVDERGQLEGLGRPIFEVEVEQDHPPLDRAGQADQPLPLQDQPVALKVAGVKADHTLVAMGGDVALRVAVDRPVASDGARGIVLVTQSARRTAHAGVAPPGASLGLPEGALPGYHSGGHGWGLVASFPADRRSCWQAPSAGRPYNLS